MKRSIWKFSRLFLVFALIIGGMVGVLRLIQYLGDTANANGGAAANGVTQADASSTDPNQLLAQSNQILAEGSSSTTTSSTISISTTTVSTKTKSVKPRVVSKPTTQVQPQPQLQPQPQPQSANILGSFMSILNNFLSIQNEATNSEQASTNAIVSSTTTATTSTPPPQPVPPTPTSTPPIQPVTPTLALPYIVNSFSDLSGWQTTWGSVAVADGMLDVGASSSTNGGGAFLENTDNWTNYIATIQLNWVKGQSFSLVARRQATSSVSCDFTSSGAISVDMTVNGRQTLLGQGMANNFTPTQPVTAWIQVDNDRVQCGLNAAVVKDYLYYGLPPELLSGGIALNTWDPQVNNMEIQVKSVDVEGL